MVTDFLNEQFAEAIDDCRRLYVDGIIECFLAEPKRLKLGHDEFFDDLQHRYAALVVKVFVETAESDLVLTPAEARLALTLVEHLLKQRVRKSKLKETFAQLAQIAKQNSWAYVTEPLHWFDQTRDHFEEFKSGIGRIANIAARVDGHISEETITQLKLIRWQLDQHLPPSREDPGDTDTPVSDQADDADAGNEHRLADVLIQLIEKDAEPKAANADRAEPCPLTIQRREEELERGMAELDSLIGIAEVRHEVRTLMNVCKLQQHRAEHSMPVSHVSLHMVFTGNPGTGKTTVARIVGKLFGGMGVLQRGHLVETDRSGLVAEYLGQTAQKTSAKIDEALDGVLFIDEAYSLAPTSQADAYGQEAVQTLLKRMEDDRDRLVVILAGYPQPMETMLKSNPGLSSRFSRHCHFPDYGVQDLCAIFERLAHQNHYQLAGEFHDRLAAEMQSRIDRKDEHFGNGRMVRNLFESAIRNLANRVVLAADLTPDLLSTFQTEDLESTPASLGSNS